MKTFSPSVFRTSAGPAAAANHPAFCTFLLALVMTWWLMPGNLAAATLPPGFALTDIGGSWNEAVGLTFDEIGTMYVWERAGRVWVVENNVKSSTPLIDIRDEVGAWEDYGLLGFALDPNFRQNGYIYLMYVVDHHYLAHYGTPQYNPSANEYYRPTIGRVTRYTALASDGFHSVNPASRTILVGESASAGFPIISFTHGVGTLVFGTDGTLLVSCGDGAQLSDPGSDPTSQYLLALSEGIIKPKENVGAFRSQMVDSLSGKILRIDPATGDGIPGNPFYDAANPRAARSRAWALGLRNPFRISLKPGTGSHVRVDANPGVLYVGDVGYQTWEEMSVVTGPGMNFGWPIFEGFTQFPPGYEDANPDNQDAPNPLYGTGGCTQQYFTFRDLLKEATLATPSWPNPCDMAQQVPNSIPHFLHARPAIDWRHGSGPSRAGIFTGNNAAVINIGASGSPVSGPQFGGNCSIGGTWYQGDDFPVQYKNTYFHTDWGGQWIRNFIFDSNNLPVSVSNFATGAEGIVAMATHPISRELYCANLFYGLQKISYGGNAPPNAVATSDVTYGLAPLSVQFTGTGSSDPEGFPLAYRWDFGDGSPVSTQANPVHVFNAPAGVPTRYDVTLTVTDSASATSIATVVISPNNTPPSVTIVSPVDGSFYPITAQTVYFLVASVSDNEHTLDQLAPRWQTVLHHNNHTHPNPVDTNWNTTTVISPLGCDGDTYFFRITLTVADAAGLSTTREVNLYPDCTTNNAPTISDIPDQAINDSQSTAAIPFTIGDAEDAADSLTLSGASSNPALVPTSNIVFGGSGSNRTVTVTPAAGQTGTATVTVSVSDGVFTASDTFVLSVFPANNTPPTISSISDQTIDEDTNTGPLSFTISDGESAAGNLSLSLGSSNPTLVPNGNIVFGGSGANRTVSVTPVANQNGTATITVSVSDGQYTTSTNFLLTVNAVNDPPTISNISDQTVNMNGTTAALTFTIGDVETVAGSLTLSMDSSTLSLVPINNIVFGGSGANRTVTVTPAAGQTGSATITVSVSDGVDSASDTFVLTVSSVVTGTQSFTNAAAITIPSVGAGTPYPSTLNVSGLGGTISQVTVTLKGFTHTFPNDVDVLLAGPAGQKVMLMSDAGGGIGVSGVNLTLSDSAAGALSQSSLVSGTFKPTDFEAGDAFPAPAPAGPYATALLAFNGLTANGTWSLYVVDDGPGDLGSFAGGWSVTITTVGTSSAAPTISDIPDQSTTANTATAAIPFTISDADTAVASLTVSGSSSNLTLVPNANVVFGGSGANRTVMVTPGAGQTGTATITVTVSDGVNSASDTFVLTVNVPNNTPPTISSIGDQTINEDGTTGPLSFTVGDAETAPGSLSLSKGSSNPVLVPTNNIVFGGSGASRTVTVSPAANQSGFATITVNVSDGQYTASTNFVVTVNAVNDPPTISNIADQTTATGTAVGPIAFTVGDVETAAGSLTVSGNSSNPVLVPSGNIVFGGSGASRTATVTPAAGQMGSATITVSVSDGALSASNTFVLTVSETPVAPLAFAQGKGAFSDASATTLTVQLTNVHAGSLLVAYVKWEGTAASTVTFSDGTSVFIADALNSAANNDLHGRFYYLLSSSASGTVNYTATWSAARPYRKLMIYEYSYGGTVSVDASGRATATAGSLTTGNITTTGNDEVVFGAYGEYGANNTTNERVNGVVADQVLRASYASMWSKSFSSPITGSATASGNSSTWIGNVIAFKREGTLVPNTAPTITDILDQVTNEDTATGAIGFTVGDAQTVAGSLTLGGSSSNQGLVPDGNIVFGGSGANRTVTVTPAANQSGSATITVSVSDGALSASNSFALTVNAGNTAPTVSDIGDQAVNEDTATGAIGFTVGDAQTVAGSLTLSGSSSNPTLVPNGNIVFGGSGASRTVTVTPAANQSGTATITVTVSDGALTASDTFVVTVNAVNDAPTITGIANQTINVDGSTGPLGITVGDVETPAGSLTVSGTSSNPTLVPGGNIVFGGSGASRTVMLTPAAGQTGSATITVSVSDGALSVSNSFTLTVSTLLTGTKSFTNTAAITIPTLGASTPYPSPINVTGMGGTVSNVTLTLYGITHARMRDIDILLVGPGGRTVIVLSDVGPNGAVNNVTLTLSDSAISALGTGTIVSGTYKPTNITTGDTFASPAPAGPYGATLSSFASVSANGAWTLYVVDDTSGSVGSIAGGWSLTVTTVSSWAPTISSIPDQWTAVTTATAAIPFTVGDVDTPVNSLTLNGGSSNPTLVPINNIVFAGSGSNRTVTVTPTAGLTGATTITVSLSDGQGSVTSSFVLTVGTLFTGTKPFTNAVAISIPSVGAATPYPSVINVSGLGGTISEVTVRLNGFAQTYPTDVDVLLAGPAGQKVMLMSDAGGGIGVSGVNLTLSDSAAGALSQSSLVSGTFKPTDYETGDALPAPAPAGPYATALLAFNGLTANGTWSLYVADDGPGDQGSFAGGWSLSITTVAPGPSAISAGTTPRIAAVEIDSQGVLVLTVNGKLRQRYAVEASSDLVHWTHLGVKENTTGQLTFSEPITPASGSRFYRAVQQPALEQQ